MQLIGAVLGGSFVFASLCVGVRLVALAYRTRRAPELLVGAGLLFLAVLGYPLMTIARRAEALEASTRVAISASSGLCQCVGAMLLLLFVRRVFRPGDVWAGTLVTLYALSLAAVFVLQSADAGWWAWVHYADGAWAAARWLLLVPISWGAVESLRYWRVLRRRQRVGLVEAAVVDRFRLFGVAMAAGFVSNAGTVVLQIAGIEVIGTSIGAVVVSPASIAAVSLWLAFMPPSAYTRRLEQREATS